MPTAWLQHRFALVLSLFFPWFPALPLSPPETELPTVGVVETAPAPQEALVLPGVVIEEIPKDSALVKAGLQVGDVILSWERLPNPPANPEAAQGALTSYFDWQELEVEQVRRGEVVLRGFRAGEALELIVEPGVWDAKTRPVLSRVPEEIYSAVKSHLAAGNLEAAARVWGTLPNSSQAESQILHTWFNLRMGEAWGEKGEWGKAVEANRAALAASENSLAQVTVLEALGAAYQMQNDYQSSEKMYLAALEARQRLHPESLGVARVLIDLGDLIWKRRGNLDRSQHYAQQALEISEKLAPPSVIA